MNRLVYLHTYQGYPWHATHQKTCFILLIYIVMFILLFQGSAMAAHILILYSRYPPTRQVPLFLRANSQQRWTKPFIETFEYCHCSLLNQKCESTSNTQFWTKIFYKNASQPNWTLNFYFKWEQNVSVFVEIDACLNCTMILGILQSIRFLIT